MFARIDAWVLAWHRRRTVRSNERAMRARLHREGRGAVTTRRAL